MKRYHFHVFNGCEYAWDGSGMMLPDLAAVVAEAEKRARSVMSTRPDIQDWSGWFVDVRGHDDITIFRFPFSEIAAAA
jgi:hypothetical protein